MSSNIFFKSICKEILVLKRLPTLHYINVRTRKHPFRTSRLLGYYEKKIPRPEYESRKKAYRENVLKSLEEMPTLQRRLEELNKDDANVGAMVDIGLPGVIFNKKKINAKEKLDFQKQMKENKEVENLARSKLLKVDLDDLRLHWAYTSFPTYLKNVAEHYNIFTDLFHHAHFTPWVPLNVFYNFNNELMTPICMGNILEAREAKDVPQVYFDSRSDDLWTLTLTNLDGHLLKGNSEYLHWLVANIKGSDICTGQTICDYLQPFPFRGTGYHRMVFILYKQDGYIDLSALKKEMPCLCLDQRTFKTYEFYRGHQDVLTPAGLAFYQCTWDSSLTCFFHNTLKMCEPMFEYYQPPMYHKKQVQFPHLEPFNLYLDNYRDPKEIAKEVLLKRMNTIHPLKEELPRTKYPGLHTSKHKIYSWQREELVNEKFRLGKYRDLRPHSIYAQEDDQGKYDYRN